MTFPLAVSDGPICSVFRETNNELRDPMPWGLVPEGCCYLKICHTAVSAPNTQLFFLVQMTKSQLR